MSTPPESSQGLPVGRRIKYNWDFTRIKTAGRRNTLGCLMLNWLASKQSGPSRLGVVVSRRVGNAVVRNRAKRLMREVFRRNQAKIPGAFDLVLIARSSIQRRSYAAVERDFMDVLRHARILG